MREPHRERVITARRTAHADADAACCAHKNGTDDGGGKGICPNFREEGWELLKDEIGEGKARGGNGGIDHEFSPKHADAEQVTKDVENGGREGGRDMKNVIEKKGEPEHAALGDIGLGVDIIQPEGEERACKKDGERVFK